MMVAMTMTMPLRLLVIVGGMPGSGFVVVATTTLEGFIVAVFFFMCAMAYAAAVFFIFLCVVFPTSAHAFFFFFHNWLVLFYAKLRTPFCNWVAKEGKGGEGRFHKNLYAFLTK